MADKSFHLFCNPSAPSPPKMRVEKVFKLHLLFCVAWWSEVRGQRSEAMARLWGTNMFTRSHVRNTAAEFYLAPLSFSGYFQQTPRWRGSTPRLWQIFIWSSFGKSWMANIRLQLERVLNARTQIQNLPERICCSINYAVRKCGSLFEGLWHI